MNNLQRQPLPLSSSRYSGPLKIAGIYLLSGGLWILFSDTLAAGIAADQAMLARISVIKGWGYVIVTALLLFWLILRHTTRMIRSDENYQLLAENISDVIWILDLETMRFRYVSPSVESLRGYSAAQALKQDMAAALTPDSIRYMEEVLPGRLDEFMKGIVRSYTDEIEQSRKNGTTVWTETLTRFVKNRDSGHLEAYGVSRDISGRKLAEKEIQLKNELLHLTGEMAEVGGWEFDAKTFEGTWTDQAARIHDLDPGQPTNVELGISFYLPGSREKIEKAVQHAVEFAQPYDLELEMVSAKGLHKWVRTMALPILENGEVVRVRGIFQDITERKLAEDELRFEKERFERIAAAVPGVIYSYRRRPDGSACIPFASPAITDILGFLPADVEQDVTPLLNRIHAADLPHVIETIAESAHSMLPWYDEFRYQHPAKGEIWIEGRSMPIHELDGSIIWHGFINDITERKRADEVLRASEERFSQLANNIQEAFWITDIENGIEIYISPAAETIWGRTVESMMGDPAYFLDSILPEDYDAVYQTLEKQKRGERTEMEYRIMRPDGSIRWMWDRAFPILDNSGIVRDVAGIAADITERKEAEAETRRHLAELEALYENGLAVSQLLEPRQIGERIIRTFAQHLSWHHVVIRLKHSEMDELEVIAFSQPGLSEGERAKVESRFNSMISTVGQGLSGWVVQTGVPLRTGNVKTYPQYVDAHEGIKSGLYMPLKIGERVIGVISVESEKADAFSAQDERLLATLANQAAIAFENARLYQSAQEELFERKRIEIILAEERNRLAIHVKDRTADLSRANASLARALRVKDEFLANMSHELRTPLNAILGLSESLGEQIAGPLNEKQLKYISTISESGRHLLSLINDILDLAKIEAGQITLNANKVDIHAVCQSSLRMIKQMSQKKRQNVDVKIDDNIGLIWADERRLKQMIVNLLSNAVKFTPEDGKLGLEVHGDHRENKLRITVWDNGIGISEADQSKLFQPFVQLNWGLARETTGTGLGLALVEQMARLHNGSITVTSRPGEGCRFTIVLPWDPGLTAESVAGLGSTGGLMPQKADIEHKHTILLVEDARDSVIMISDYLEAAGYRVVTAQDGVEGIDQAKLTQPDLILMDIQMPRMDGLEAARRLKRQPQFKSTPIIALTALAMPNDRERCLEAGMDGYIGKPVNLKALVKTIRKFLSNKEGAKPR